MKRVVEFTLHISIKGVDDVDEVQMSKDKHLFVRRNSPEGCEYIIMQAYTAIRDELNIRRAENDSLDIISFKAVRD